MAKKPNNKPAPEDEIETKDILYRMPRVLYDEARRRSGNAQSVQGVITLALAVLWGVPPPPVRTRGRQKKQASN